LWRVEGRISDCYQQDVQYFEAPLRVWRSGASNREFTSKQLQTSIFLWYREPCVTIILAMPPFLLRLAYVGEFLLALIAYEMVWSQVGGQGHLDLMPWYTKLGLMLGLALATVLGTAAAVSHNRVLNAKTIGCVVTALLLVAGMAWATYYQHLHENDETPANEGPMAGGAWRTSR
jgi:hypothetical protein